MAKAKTLELSIKIAGEVDKTLTNAIASTQSSISSLSTNLSKIGTVGLTAMAALATGTVAAIAECTNVAEEFEAAMADVVKYVDGLADETGEISDKLAENGQTYAENYETAKSAILDLSTQIPYTAEELTELAASAGQSGYSIDELFSYDEDGNVQGFLKDVAMWGVAMDIDAEQAGDWAAKWEVAFDMTHDEVMELADIINYLGANSATTAAEIAEVVNETVSMGDMAGVDATTTVAIADAMLAMGVTADSAGTSIKRMYVNLTKGYAASSTITNALAKLGMTATEVAESMVTDGTGTILEILEAIGELPESEQLATVSSLFGQWAVEGGGKLVENLDTLKEILEMAQDVDSYTGSMEREFIIKASTAESIDTMLSNSWYALQEEIGEEFLPVKKEFSLMLIDLVATLRDNMPALEAVAESAATVLSNGVSALGEALENALPYIQEGLDYVANNGDKVAEVIAGLAAAFATMKAAPLIETLLTGASSLLFGTTSTTGTKSGGIISSAVSGISGLFTSAKNTVTAAGIGANLANSTLTGNTTGKSSVSNSVLGAIFGAKNTAGLTSTGSDKSFMKSLTSTAGQIISAKEAGGLSGLVKNSSIGKYVGNIGSSLSGMFSGLLSFGTGDAGSLSGLSSIFSSFGSLVTGVLSPVTTMFSGILSTVLPIIAVVGSIIAVLSILYDNLDGVRDIIGNVFGDTGLAVFDKFESGLTNVVDKVQTILNGGLAEALSGVKEKFVGMLDGDTATLAGQTFDSIVMIVQSVLGVVGQLVDFSVNTLRPIIEEIFSYLTATVIPMILQAFNTAAPIISSVITNIGTAVMTVAEIIGTAILKALPYIENIITVILSIASVVIPAVLSGFNSLWSSLSSVVQSIQLVFEGLITFVTGVFTGDWETAWTGVKDIFQNAFEALVELAKVPINAVIALINGAISGINSLGITIPDWVPVLGGQSFSIDIPEIPMLASGGFTNEPSIAGEAGTEAVISFDSAAREQNVVTWMQAGKMLGINVSYGSIPDMPMFATGGFTSGPSIAGEAGTEAVISFDSGVRAQNINTWTQAGQMLDIDSLYGSTETELKEIDTSGSSVVTESVTFAPQITIQGNADENTVDEMMSEMKAMFEKWYEQRQRQQARTAY